MAGMRCRRYLWEHPEWPALTWDADRLAGLHADARRALVALQDRVAKLPPELSGTVRVDGLVRELVSSWQIEGERLDEAAVRAAVRRRLALPSLAEAAADPAVEGAVAALLEASAPACPVTTARLLDWHAGLFPAGMPGVASGRWRDDARGPMQVVSGPLHRPKVHFVAPPATRLEAEMARLLEWMERTDPDPLLRAAVVHLWFVTIHPFDDGNGRLARILTEREFARATGGWMVGMSVQIAQERKGYYAALERVQASDMDVTGWMEWFLGCHLRATRRATTARVTALAREAAFWHRHAAAPLSVRQRRVLARVLNGFEGRLTVRKGAALGKCPVEEAQRDVEELLACGVLEQDPESGRRQAYRIR